MVGDPTDPGTVAIRPLTLADEDAVRRLHEHLDDRELRPRFVTGLPRNLTPLPEPLCRPDERHVGLSAFAGDTLVGVAHYTVVEPETGAGAGSVADRALVVDPRARYHGIGTALARRLTAHARAHGLIRARAHVLPENTALLEVLRSVGWSRTGPAGVTVEMTLPLLDHGTVFSRLDE